MTLPSRLRRLRAPLCGWLLLGVGACAQPAEPPIDAGTSSSSSSTTDPSVDAMPTVPGSAADTVADEAPAEDSNEGSGDLPTDASSSSSGAPPNDCDPVVPGGFNACYNENGVLDQTMCNWMPGDDPSMWVTCITAAAIEGGNVCTISDCVDRCDCFAHPGTGTATVECMEGVIAAGPACVLYCGGGELCPDGMECSYQICVWPPA